MQSESALEFLFGWIDPELAPLLVIGLTLWFTALLGVPRLGYRVADRMHSGESTRHTSWIVEFTIRHISLMNVVTTMWYSTGLILCTIYFWLRTPLRIWWLFVCMLIILPILLSPLLPSLVTPLQGGWLKNIIDGRREYLEGKVLLPMKEMLIRKYGTDEFIPYVQHLFELFEPPMDGMPRCVISEWEKTKRSLMKRDEDIGRALAHLLSEWKAKRVVNQ